MDDRELAADNEQRVTFNGVKGTFRPLSADDSRLLVSLDDGRSLIATPDMLQKQRDGSCVLLSGAAGESVVGSHVEAVIPVIREELALGKRIVERDSGVRLRKSVSEREEEVVQLLYRESLDVERIPRNQIVDRSPPVRHEGDTLVIPVCEEVLVLEKRLLLKEEIRVARREHHVRHAEKVVLRTEHVTVERFGEAATAADTRASNSAASRLPPHTS